MDKTQAMNQQGRSDINHIGLSDKEQRGSCAEVLLKHSTAVRVDRPA